MGKKERNTPLFHNSNKNQSYRWDTTLLEVGSSGESPHQITARLRTLLLRTKGYEKFNFQNKPEVG